MRSAHASLVVFSGLAALATGEALPPADIPIRCATICGPMVELTALCSPRGKLAKRRRLDDPGRLGAGNGLAAGGGPVRDDDRLERRTFVTLVPAPTSFPYELTAGAATAGIVPTNASPPSPSPTSSQLAIQEAGNATAIPSRVTPVIITPPHSTPPPLLRPPPPPPPPALNVSPAQPAPRPATTTGIALGANGPPRTTTAAVPPAASSGSPTLLPTSAASQMEPDRGAPAMPAAMDAEEKCVCLNRSFDVARVAGLCASCVMQAGDVQNNMHVIMAACNFSSQEYTPGKDDVANNINVVASAPAAAVWGQKAGVASEAPRMGSLGLAVGAAWFVMAVAMLL